jgi:hypothetical protein
VDWLWCVEDLGRYGGWDFLGMGLTFCSLLLLGRRRRVGFLVGALANVAWFVFAWKARSTATLAANLLFGCMNLWVWSRWRAALPGSSPETS